MAHSFWGRMGAGKNVARGGERLPFLLDGDRRPLVHGGAVISALVGRSSAPSAQGGEPELSLRGRPARVVGETPRGGVDAAVSRGVDRLIDHGALDRHRGCEGLGLLRERKGVG